jgi:hypothetical protein
MPASACRRPDRKSWGLTSRLTGYLSREPFPGLPLRTLYGNCVVCSPAPRTVLSASRAAFGSGNRAYVGHGAKRMWLHEAGKPSAAKSSRLVLQEHHGASNE